MSDAIQLIQKMHATDRDATQLVLAALQDADAEAIELMSHLVGARQVWLARLARRSLDGLAVFPKGWSLAQCRERAAQVHAAWDAYLQRLDETELNRDWQYTNLRGERCHIVTLDALVHLVTHGYHHRAQICRLIRQAGRTPPSLDYINFHRKVLA